MSVRNLSLAVLGLAILIMAEQFFEYLRYAMTMINYRYEILDAEGIVWQQVMMIPGPNVYGDINKYPYIVFHYPPLYHLLVRAASWLGGTPLHAGRAVSVAATVVSGATISAIGWRLARADTGRLAALMGGAVAGLAYFSFYPIVLTSELMRVDMLAIAFSLLGLLCFTTSRIGSWRPYLGMVFFVLGVFTKQTALTAPLAAMAVTAVVAPRQALKLLGFGLVLGAVPMAILIAITDGGVLRHLVSYNINRFYPSLIWEHVSGQAPLIIFVTLALAAIVLWWRRFVSGVRMGGLRAWREAMAGDDGVRGMMMVTVYLTLTTLMLTGLGKNGSSLAYFNEWVGVLSLLLGVLAAAIAAPDDASGVLGSIRFTPAMKLALPILLIVQVLRVPESGPTDFNDPVHAQQEQALVDMIARADKPVLSTDMVALMNAGKQVPWEPAIFAELASMGRWDETQITRRIAAHEFALVVTRSTSNFNPAVDAAVAAAYPRVTEIAQHVVHLPPE